MKVRNSQLRDFLNTIKYDEELLKQMKEKFYLEKIQEAKDKKGIVQFKWDELPIEVEEHIMEWKKIIESVSKKNYTISHIHGWRGVGNGYIQEMIKKHHLTMKSFYRWIRQGYKNDDGVAIRNLPKFRNGNFDLVLSAMVNKECIYEAGWGNPLAPESQHHKDTYDILTKNKTPSLEEYIKYRKKEKKIKIEENKKKKDEINSKYDKVKIGSIYLKNGKVFKILSETKTQYRVEVLSMDDTQADGGDLMNHSLIQAAYMGKREGTRRLDIEWLKHKNMSKSKWMLNTHGVWVHSETEVEIYKATDNFNDEYPYYIKPA